MAFSKASPALPALEEEGKKRRQQFWTKKREEKLTLMNQNDIGRRHRQTYNFTKRGEKEEEEGARDRKKKKDVKLRRGKSPPEKGAPFPP